MDISNTGPQGLWLPLITPFSDGELDEPSLRRMIRHYAGEPVDGIITAATTGEALTLSRAETERLIHIIRDELQQLGADIQLYAGLSGSDTAELANRLDASGTWPVDGYLIACPYYTRPSQSGLVAHFSALSDGTDRPILIYNIPYRTGVNLENEAMLELAERHNIAGVKDCCADPDQTFDLLRHRPSGFSVLTGEDAHYFSTLCFGGDGGILASAHVQTRAFAAVRTSLLGGDHAGALQRWRRIADLPRLLFSEPSPAPVKRWLWRAGLIDSPEVRLPMTQVSAELARRIDGQVERLPVFEVA